jgi:carboxyl-terminal processing protease
MPRRNLYWLIGISIVSLICYQKIESNRYGRILNDAMAHVERRYVETVEPSELFEGAMDGMMSRLDDPYSDYIAPVVREELNVMLSQEFGGVGMEVSSDPRTKQLTVTSPLVGTPAYRAGIRAGDTILRIDEHSCQGLSLEDAVRLMRGKPGDAVVVTVLHEGEKQPVEIKIVREIIHVSSVLGDSRNADSTWNFWLEGHDRIGYVRINTFSSDTVEELKRALDELTAHGMRGLILDLRDDPGGLLKAAKAVCDLFIDEGVIVSTVGRDKEHDRQVEMASGQGTFLHFPMAVLVNHFSASASEIVAACLQDHHRAVIVGERTWGKGTVQEVIDLPDGAGALKLTTAGYWRPSGRNIQKHKNDQPSDEWGVKPDAGYEVVVEGEELNRLHQQRLHRDAYRQSANGTIGGEKEERFDPQLAKALEYLDRELARKK